ncbi:MAG TPA: class I SAM-dependent methyltransferase [Gaiellaceae bacterium]|jgi:SAM-dependent methyltransferase
MGPLERLREWRIDRMTDRIARRPHGRKARETYGAPDVHDFMWPTVLESLQLQADDRLLDVGCGGGVFLRHARDTTGCAVRGIDHSGAMVRLARPLAVLGEADRLPFADAEFTAISSIAAFFFFPTPVDALKEIYRVLDAERGRIAICTTSPEAKGSPAAPYPLATRGHFYTDDELHQLARDAGFTTVSVTRPDESGWAQLLAAQP